MEKIKTYRCKNDNCQFYLANKKKGTDKRKTLFKGVIIDKSFVIVECPACRQALEVNVEDKSNVDKTKVSPIELLKRERVANS